MSITSYRRFSLDASHENLNVKLYFILGMVIDLEVPLTMKQCFLLIFAGSLSHFFLDHLFEENGHSSMYTWILSTGWWKTRAPINPDAVVVISLLCASLIGGFIYIYRVKPLKSSRKQYHKSLRLILVIASTYCLWCASQIYLVSPRRPAVGEEADLGVLVFLGVFFFLPHWLHSVDELEGHRRLHGTTSSLEKHLSTPLIMLFKGFLSNEML
ncbi:UNVERIFIED_CONTAM: hypothetical protein Scaly_1944100 [Sesamum calycinum]|uniref:Uncharacterized protein n=1 Tax=Sesamum calycinum TaxID=2727403 RepID=A0AAW2NHD2_9LAMI